MRAAPLALLPGDRDELGRWLRSSTIRAGLAQRARIVLLAADGCSHVDVAAQVGVSVPTVRQWRTRYAHGGLAGLSDAERSGRPETVDDRKIVEATLRPPPKTSGVRHWSSRLLAPRSGVDQATVARAWKAYGVQPWRAETLDIATGKVTAACKPRHRHQEFLAFLKQVAKACPEQPGPDGRSQQLHLVMDDYAAHERVEVRDWLAANPRVRVHFTPTSGSWLDLVEVWFGIIERQAIHRGSSRSVRDLDARIRASITAWNDRAHPFVRTKTPEEILREADRRHQRTTSAT